MHIRRATRDDLADIATVASRGMMGDPLSLYLSPRQAEFPHLHRERCLRTTFRRWNNGMILLVAVTDEQDPEWNGKPKVVGYAAYEKEVGAEDDSSKAKNTWFGGLERFLYRIRDNYDWYFRNYLGTDKERWQEVVSIIYFAEIVKQYDRYWELDFLAVDPAFGRRGIGGSLVDWGLKQAEQDQAPMLLGASAKGYPLYKRRGFQEITELTVGGLVPTKVMVWNPSSLVSSTTKSASHE